MGEFGKILTFLPLDAWALNGIVVVLLSVLITGILIPRILLISYRRNLFDLPSERKIHNVAVPRLGGMAFMPALVIAIAAVIGMNMPFIKGPELVNEGWDIRGEAEKFCFGICSLMIMYLVGLADDLIGVKYRAKFVAQIIVGLLLAFSGMLIDNLGGFLGIYELPYILSVPLTVLVSVLVLNAINLIDGIDGLASGLSAISLGFYAAVFYVNGSFVYYLISMATLGTLVPFFYYNVFGNQKMGKKIFMGDTGALTTGFILIFLSLKILELPAGSFGGASVLVLAFAPLVVPCFDVVRVFFHRLRRRQSPFMPGRVHIHHKFLALGVNQRFAMITILIISVIFITVDVIVSPAIPVLGIVVIDLLLWIALNLWLTRSIRQRQRIRPADCDFYD